MDSKVFEILGKYAGLAGFCIGLVALVFLAILKKDITNNKQAVKLVSQMMYLTFTIGVIGIAAWLIISLQSKSSKEIKGRVMEKETREAIADAEITVAGFTESAHTDGAGNFSLALGENTKDVLHLYVSRSGYAVYDRGVKEGQTIEAEMVKANTGDQAHLDPKPPINTAGKDSVAASLPTSPKPVPLAVSTEIYKSDSIASGACDGFGAWTTLCSADKPAGWTIENQTFQLLGDRAGCAYAHCEPLGTPTATKACYRVQTQGHNEECGHSGNTGIHYSEASLTVTWTHPQGQ